MAQRPQIELSESNLERLDCLRTQEEPVPPRTAIANRLLAEIMKAKLAALTTMQPGARKSKA